MSNPITAGWQDTRINDIRAAVGAKNGTVPFLLLPVRIETRFMRVPKYQAAKNSHISEILERFSAIQIKLIGYGEKRVDAPTLTALDSEIGKLRELVAASEPTAKQKSWFKTLYTEIKTERDALINKNGLSRGVMMMSLGRLSFDIRDVKVSKEKSADTQHELLLKLKEAAQKMAILTDRNRIPFTNFKNKKDLYAHIEKTIADIEAIMVQCGEMGNGLTSIHGNQTKRLAEVSAQIKGGTQRLATALLTLHRDQNWQSFVRKIDGEKLTGIRNALASFERKTLPRLKSLPIPEAVYDENDMHFHGIQTLAQVKRFNLGPTQTYKDIKGIQQKLALRTQAMQKMAAAGFSEQASKAVKNIYTQIRSELKTSKTRVEKFAPKNNSQIKGKDIVTGYIEKWANTNVENVIGNMPVIPPAGNGAPEFVNQLWVRIYPDDIAINTHERALTDNEISAGQQFWKSWWAASGNEDLEKAAFKNLARMAGIRRAAWIIRSNDPRNEPLNATILAKKPSANAQDALKKIDKVNDALQALSNGLLDKTPESAMALIEPVLFNGHTDNLHKACELLAARAFEVDYVMQRIYTGITKIGSVLNMFIDKMNALNPNSGQVFALQIEALGKLGNEFGPLMTIVDKMEVLPFDAFAKKLEYDLILKFPDVFYRDKEWTEAPHTKVMPERFAVVTVRNGAYVHVAVGEQVPAKLQVGVNPADTEDNTFFLDENGDLHIDEKMLWMVEYREALKVGMAVSIDLTETQAANGFDKVFVLGVKNTNTTDSEQLLTELMQGHIYAPDGMSFLKVGSPTNNTQKDPSGYKPDADADKIFNLELKDVPAKRAYQGQTDAERLGKALGLTSNILGRGVDANNTSVSDALVVNRALWNATLGHYMEEMWDGIFTYDNIRRTEKFFVENLTARGFLPSIRVGAQPYGILPTTAFSRFEPYPGLSLPSLSVAEATGPSSPVLEDRIQQRFDIRLQKVLNELQKEWQSFTVMHAGILGANPDNYQKNYMNMLGLHATSLGYNVRYAVNVGKGPEFDPADADDSVATNFNANDLFGPHGMFEKYKELLNQGIYSRSFHYWSEGPAAQPNYKVTDGHYTEILNNLSRSRIFVARFLQTQPELKGNMVDRNPLSDNLLTYDYIKWLLESEPSAILASNNWANLPDKTLLFMLMRQSIMQAYQEAALNILQTERVLTEPNRRGIGNTTDYLTYDSKVGRRQFSTKWHYLLKNIQDMEGMLRMDVVNNAFYGHLMSYKPGATAMSKYVFEKNRESMLLNQRFVAYPGRANHQADMVKLDEIRAAFKAMAAIPTKDLDVLLAEHLDLCTYRLDAWQLGFVNRRLKQHRTVSPQGIHMGAFGWVENLRRDDNRHVKPVSEIPPTLRPEDDQKTYADPDNEGFIHGPSVQHGVTAAILRAAYLANRKNNGAGSRLSVNLSSERVRQALAIIEGIRNGMDIGAILGFQFERGLHERYALGAELDRYIQPLRDEYPLANAVTESAQPADANTYRSLTIDGKKLLDDVFNKVNWYESDTDKTLETLLTENNYNKLPAQIKNLTANASHRKAIINEIDRLADMLDSLGDLVLSEGVYQVVKGNHVRAAAALASVSPDPKTASSIPNPEIVETPRTGTVVSQRVVLSLAPVDKWVKLTGWEKAPVSPRAAAEPALNAWLGSLFGPAEKIGCEVLVAETAASEPKSRFYDLDDLAWQPIDYFFYAVDESVLTQKISDYARTKDTIGPDGNVWVQLKSKNGQPHVDGRSFYEMDWLIGQVRQILEGTKPLANPDFMGVGEQLPAGAPEAYETEQFTKRAEMALKALSAVAEDFEAGNVGKAIIEENENIDTLVLSESDVTEMNALLERLAQFGVNHMQPALGSSSATLVRKVLGGYNDAQKRVAEAAAALAKNLPTTSGNAMVENAITAFKVIFGKAFLALPQFKMTNLTLIKKQLANPYDPSLGILRNGKTLAMDRWLHGVGKVREKMYAVEMLSTGMESLNGATLGLLPAQLSYTDGDYWVGMEYPETFTPDGDKLSITFIQPQHVGNVCCGILIDDWVEIIPNKEETTGLSFNYNQPDAMPPQTILLAVNPEDHNNWSWDNLLHTLEDTLALAKIRAVEPDHIEKSRYALVLPSVVAEVAPAGVSDDDGNPLGVQVALDFIKNNLPNP